MSNKLILCTTGGIKGIERNRYYLLNEFLNVSMCDNNNKNNYNDDDDDDDDNETQR